MSFLSEDAPVSQAFDLTGRVAAITGAASGIGRSTAYVLSGAGATVVLGAIDSGAPTLAVYSMAKAAVAILTKTVAAEGAPHKIRANSLAPGIVLTGFSRPHFTSEDGEIDDAKLEGYKEWASKTAPLGRIG